MTEPATAATPLLLIGVHARYVDMETAVAGVAASSWKNKRHGTWIDGGDAMGSSVSDIMAIARTKRLAAGGQVRVASLTGVFVITGNDDPAYIELQSVHGVPLRVGRLRIRPIGGAAAADRDSAAQTARRLRAGHGAVRHG